MSFLRKVIFVNGAECICFGLGIFQSVILSRVLGPAGVGQYAVILSAMILAAQLFSLGFPLSFLYHSQHDPANAKVYLINTIWSMLFMGAFGGIILTTIIYYNTGYFGKTSWIVLLAIFAYIPIVLQRAIVRNHLLIAIEAKRLGVMNLCAMIGAVLAILILAWLDALNIGRAILCFILAATIRAGLGWFWIRGNVDFSIKPQWKINLKLGLMGIRQSWLDLMILVNAQLNILIIKFLMDNFESVGYFSRGQLVAMLAVTAGRAVLPLLFSQWASLPQERLVAHVEKTMRFAFAVGIVVIAVILLGAKQIILLLYGREFLPAVTSAQILVLGTVLYLISRALTQLLGSQGVPEVAAIALFCGALVNAVLSWPLIYLAGINGAALAATISHVVLLALLMIIVKRKYGIRVSNCIVMNRDDIRSAVNSLKFRKPKNV